MEIPGYIIDSEIGQGGMATVYLATQSSLERRVALKVIKPSLVAEEDFTRRFLREGKIIAQLIDSRIITIFDIGSHENFYYLAMEYLPGGSLSDRIIVGLTLPEALSIAKTIAGALGVAHQRGFIHRDIKPQNILFRGNGNPVLTDFGVAKALHSSTLVTKSGISLGTPRYMSPEQIKGLTVDVRSDWYSFGVLFYEMLTGEIPFSSDDSFALAFKHLTEPVPQLPDELAAYQPILDKLLAKEPDERYSSSEQFISALNQVEHDEGVVQESVERRTEDAEPRQRPASPLKPRQLGIALVALAGLLFGGAYWFLHTPEGAEPSSEIAQTSPPDDPTQSPPSAVAEQPRPAAISEYLAAAELDLQRGALEAAQDQIAKGLQIVPDNPELLALQNTLREIRDAQQQAAAQAEAEQRQQQAQAQLATAQQLRQAGDLQSSLQTVNEALALVPYHGELLTLQQELVAQQAAQQEQAAEAAQRQQQAEQLLVRARLSFQAGNLESSLATVERGLDLVPDYPDLLALQEEIIAKQAQAEPSFTAQLEKCAGHFQANRLTSGRGGNAFACYTEVLQQDPGNEVAQLGLQRIADRYIGWTQNALREGELDKASSLLDRLEQVNPQAPQLVALREEVAREEAENQAQQEAAAARAAAEAQARAEAEQNQATPQRRPPLRVFDDTMRTR